MKNQMTSRDFELISAYLDNQLGSKERAIFEERLKLESELRTELQQISKTRLLVRQLPRLRAPHNYFIKAEATQTRPNFRMAPVFGIVSAIASVLLALVIFGSTFFTTSPQVAMAPAAQNNNPPLAAQPEIGRNVTSPISTTEAPLATLMGATALNSTSPNTSTLETGQTEISTPTTIYLFAYPPTSTPGQGISKFEQETEVARTTCQNYYGGGTYPTSSGLDNCPTPTGTISVNIENTLPTSTPAPSATPTLTATATPTPTNNPAPTASPTPTPTETTSSIEKLVQPGIEVSPTEIAPSDQSVGAGNPTSAAQQPTETPVSPNVSFLSYILLTVEISLAAIAIIAGITAIILRLRAR